MNRRSFLGATGLGITGIAGGGSKPRVYSGGIINPFFASEEIQPAKYKPEPRFWSDHDVTAAWIGHSTVLINFFGTRIVTDPILSRKAGVTLLGLVTIGPQRLVAPALTLEEIGKVDIILLSHAHMDHLDYPTISEMESKETTVVMAKHTKDVIEGLDFRKVTEVDWGESVNVGDLTIEGLQVRHFGWRYPWEDDRSRGERNGRSYNAYLVKKNGISLVFGGDTAYTDAFQKLGAKNQQVDLAIMPIGTYDPWRNAHCNPEEAVSMCRDMNARSILPIHWSTFIVSQEPVMEPIRRLKKSLESADVSLALDAIGETVQLG